MKSAKKRQTYKCKVEECSWRIRASTASCGTKFMIKTYSADHTCQAVRNNEHTFAKWIARVLRDEFRVDPFFSLKSIRQKLKDKYGLTGLHKSKIFRARVRAR